MKKIYIVSAILFLIASAQSMAQQCNSKGACACTSRADCGNRFSSLNNARDVQKELLRLLQLAGQTTKAELKVAIDDMQAPCRDIANCKAKAR